jgi:hypothetical protein
VHVCHGLRQSGKEPTITDCPLVQVPLSPSAFPIFQTIKTRTFYVSALHDEFWQT